MISIWTHIQLEAGAEFRTVFLSKPRDRCHEYNIGSPSSSTKSDVIYNKICQYTANSELCFRYDSNNTPLYDEMCEPLAALDGPWSEQPFVTPTCSLPECVVEYPENILSSSDSIGWTYPDCYYLQSKCLEPWID